MERSARDLESALGRGPLLLDGGVGTELRARAGAHADVELLNVERPELVRAVHSAWLDAGCDVLTTNSFCADAPSLLRRGLAGRSVELGTAAARLARECADRDGRRRYVLGSLGPGWTLPTRDGGDDGALARGYLELARAMVTGGVDALLVETVRDLRQARAALAGARTAAPDVARLIAFAPFADGTLAGGVTLAAAVDELREFEPALLGVNCVEGAAGCERALTELRATGARHLGAWPNAGRPDTSGAAPRWPIEPETFARDLASCAQRFGLRLVGGCCGTTPAHLSALAGRMALGARLAREAPGP